MKAPGLGFAFSPVRKLTLLYVTALTSIAVMSIVGQALIQTSLARQRHDSHVVNIAGRQRMLSQKLAKNALALDSTSDPLSRDVRRRELGEVVALWERSHLGLQLGDEALQLPGENTAEVRRMFTGIEQMHREMVAAAKSILAGAEPLERARRVRVILDNEAKFLLGMDRIVFQYSAESAERVAWVARTELGLLLVTLLVLALEGAFVFRPAAQRLRRTIEDLWDTEDRLRREKASAERVVASMQRAPTASVRPPLAIIETVKG